MRFRSNRDLKAPTNVRSEASLFLGRPDSVRFSCLLQRLNGSRKHGAGMGSDGLAAFYLLPSSLMTKPAEGTAQAFICPGNASLTSRNAGRRSDR